MYSDHEVFEKPTDENVKIWRYMGFTKFVSLLQKQALFFVSGKILQMVDPKEGVYPKTNRERLLNAELPIMIIGHGLGVQQTDLLDPFMVANCWHINDVESPAMWHIYSQMGEGVAIRSTFARLVKSFSTAEQEVFIGLVKYIEHSVDVIPEGNAFIPFLHKWKGYDYERELRAMSVIPMTAGAEKLWDIVTLEQFDQPENIRRLYQSLREYGGIFINVNLSDLIETVYLYPKAPKWFEELVRTEMKTYGVDAPIKHSSHLNRD